MGCLLKKLSKLELSYTYVGLSSLIQGYELCTSSPPPILFVCLPASPAFTLDDLLLNLCLGFPVALALQFPLFSLSGISWKCPLRLCSPCFLGIWSVHAGILPTIDPLSLFLPALPPSNASFFHLLHVNESWRHLLLHVQDTAVRSPAPTAYKTNNLSSSWQYSPSGLLFWLANPHSMVSMAVLPHS